MTAVAAVRPATAARRVGRLGGLVVAAVVLALLALASLALGSRDISLIDVIRVLTDASSSTEATVIREMRLPRTLLAVCVGAALALGGTLLQGLARNPLADPGVLGINSGAAVALVAGALTFGTMPAGVSVWFAFGGAAVATVAVYAIASVGREGTTPVKLALAGAAVTALAESVTSAIILADPAALDTLRMWQVGALAGR